MNQLSGLDATFLYIETPQMPMHVGALHVLELPAGYKGRFVSDLRRHIAQRLPVAPVLRRRLWWMPLNMANPAWVDAEPDLRQHIVEVRLPRTAREGDGMAALEAEVSRLHPVLLDRSRPLWKFHVFEGLAPTADGRRRVALYSQLHHAAVDGQAAVALANAILDPSPEPRSLELRPSTRPRAFKLEMTEMLRGVLARQAQQVAGIIRELPATVGTLKDTATRVVAGSALLGNGKGVSNLTLAPRTPLNVSVGSTRAYAALSLPLAELKLAGRAHGATLNDTVLWLAATALRRFFGKRKLLPRKSMVAAVPISLREKGDVTSDNQASMSLVSLGTHLADPLKRMAHIQAAAAAMKDTMGPLKSVLPTDFPSLGVPWLLEAAASLYGKARMADRLPQVANLVISNVPGPPVPLYMAGARMVTNYPTSIVVHGLALNLTVQSYDRSLDCGFMADGAAMADVRELADAMGAAFDDLLAMQPPDEPAPTVSGLAAGLARDMARGVVDRARKGLGPVVEETVRGVSRSVASGVIKGMAGGVGDTVAAKAKPRTARKPR